MSISVNTRFEWIDITKGIGILLVVYGHIFTGKAAQFFYLFHMPLFFFIAGYLLRVSPDQKRFFYKKFVQLLVPYATFLVLLYIPQEILSVKKGEDTILKGLIRPIVGGKMLIGWTAVFWFVTCFFLTQQMLHYIIRKYRSVTINYIIGASLVLSYINQLFFPNLWLPWNANVVFASLPIMYMGYLYKNNEARIKDYVLWIFFLLVMTFTSINDQNTLDMKSNNYGLPLISLASAIVLVLVLIYAIKRIPKSNVIVYFFAKLGGASMVIMYLHQIVQSSLEVYFGVESQAFRFFASIVIPVFVFELVSLSRYGRILFLGSLIDFEHFTSKGRVER